MHFYANSYPEIVETKLLANNSGILKPNYARLMFSHSKYYMYIGKQYVYTNLGIIHALQFSLHALAKKVHPFVKY